MKVIPNQFPLVSRGTKTHIQTLPKLVHMLAEMTEQFLHIFAILSLTSATSRSTLFRI